MKSLDEWLREKGIESPNTMRLIEGLQADLEEIAKGLGCDLEIVVLEPGKTS